VVRGWAPIWVGSGLEKHSGEYRLLEGRKTMKIAVTSSGETLTATVDLRFGRAKKFIIIDTETNETQVVDNSQNLNAVQGAGIQAGQNVSRLGVEAVITGHCGPKAFRALQAAGVKIFLAPEGTVGEAVEKFKAGELTETGKADVEGHWV